ncbi:MAG: phosphatidylglycerol lysyltransferase domain-containing protein [Clostridia bacterium]|nr:phosphatidylglycerol lysyltransferase domain-containing protein [Clostridia bacterium]
MFDFHQPTEDDIPMLKKTLDEAQPDSCEFSISNILCWCSHYGAEIAEADGCIISKTNSKNLFGFPKGKNFEIALSDLEKEFPNHGFYGLTAKEKDKLEQLFPGKYEFAPTRSNFDYVYRVETLAQLPGKKYHAKRNHISFFEKTYNWTYEEINHSNMPECIEMSKKWYEINTEKNPEEIKAESEVLNLAFDLYDKLDFAGGLIRVDGEVIAFTMGEKLNDKMFDTHFEKAFADIRGAYPIINREFAKNTINNYEFVNREDDVGSEGLRKAKLSYHPEFLVEKFTAVIK